MKKLDTNVRRVVKGSTFLLITSHKSSTQVLSLLKLSKLEGIKTLENNDYDFFNSKRKNENAILRVRKGTFGRKWRRIGKENRCRLSPHLNKLVETDPRGSASGSC